MNEDNPPPLPPRSMIRHIPGHTDHNSALQQQDLQLWQHVSMSQPQQAAGVQALPVGMGYNNRPQQQQLWADQSSAFSQRGWQPFPQAHTQQSPQESQELNPQVVRSQQQNWPGEMNQLQLQQLQQLIWLQQQQQLQLQQQQQQPTPEQGIHHLDPIGHGHRDDQSFEKFTKSPSPQIEENRNSPAVGRTFMHNVTSPQQQMWQHPQVMHQYDMQHGEPQHSQAFQHTPVSHQQPLFAQQQYVQPAVWQPHSPYSQVQMQHIRQSTPPIQQHVLWHQQQQQQLHQHQLQQQQHQQPQQQHAPADPPPPYSPPSNSFLEKSPIKKEPEVRNESVSLFNNNRLPGEPTVTVSRNDSISKVETNVLAVSGLTPSAPPFSLNNQPVSEPMKPIRILSKSSEEKHNFTNTSQRPHDTDFPPVSSAPQTSPQPLPQRPIQGVTSNAPVSKPQSFNPNPNLNPYQNLNPHNVINKSLQGLYGSQNAKYSASMKDGGFGQAPHMQQFRQRSPGSFVRNQIPNPSVTNNMFQRNAQMSASNVHHVENVEINIFVQGLNPRTRAESIQNYFEAIGRPAAVKDGILFNLEHTEALVIFQQKPDIAKLKQTVNTRKLDGFSLEICEVPPPRGVVVSSEGHLRSREILVYYFERQNIGGGPLKKNGDVETEDGCCLLEFEDHRVVQRLCSGHRQHRVDGMVLRVSPYYQCENGAIWDMNLHIIPIPKPVNIQILPDQLEFVKKHCQPQFTARLRDKYADLTFSKDHVTVKCSLRQAMPNYRTLVRGWETGVQEAVAKFLAGNIDQADIGVPELIWDKLMDFLNSGRPEFKDLLMKPHREQRSIKIVGYKVNVKLAHQVLSGKVETLSREARRKCETRKVKSVEKLTVLEIQGTFSAICKKYGDMKIHVEGNEVTVEGDPVDIPNAFIEMYAECDKIEPVEFKHSKTREWVSFAKKDTSVKYIQKKLDQKRIRGSWEVSGASINVYVANERNSKLIKNVILESILEESIPVDKSSTDLLNSEVWGDFLLDSRQKFRDKIDVFTKKQQTVVVVGSDDIAPHVAKLMKEFLDSKTVKTVTVHCEAVVSDFIAECWTESDFAEIQNNDVVIKTKANGIELTGLSENLIKGKQKLDMKLKRMCSKRHFLKRTGIHAVLQAAKHSGTISAIEKETRCIIKLPQDIDESISAMLSDYEVIETEMTEEDTQPTSAASTQKCFQTKRHKIKIQLVHGEIGHQKADVIACSASNSLNLRSGSASYSLVKQGGAQLQTDCNRLFPDGIQDGEVAVIDSGNLNCDKVYLTSLPAWKDTGSNGRKVYRNFMRECLRLADHHSKKTIAISAMGTGAYLGYPRDVVASIMYGAVVEFDNSYSKTSLKEVSVVIYNKDTDTVQAFEEHEHMRLYGSASLGALSTDFMNGKIKVELVTDDLSKQKVDALLCSVSSDMNLTRSAICKSLVQNGGTSLQEECKQKYKNELSVGKVVDISGGKLPCKTVYLTVLPTYTESSTAEQSLINTLQTVFQLANLKGYKSLAIPALGTGYLNYPKTTAAKCMYDAVLHWVGKNPKASLKMVRFVMYSKDTEAQQAYRLCHLQTQGREVRSNRNFMGDGTVMVRPDDNAKYRMIKDGCVIGPVQLLVQVGDLLNNKAEAIVNGVGANFDMKGAIAQALVKKCPNILPECQDKKAELKKDGVVVTGSAGLQATYVIHVLFQDSLAGWRTKMVTCLEEANRKLIKTVAFPVLASGSGPRTFPPDGIAECLFTAIDDFSSQNSNSSVTEVRLVIHDSNAACKPAIMSALQGKTTAASSQSALGKFLGFMAEKMGFAKKPDSGKDAAARHQTKGSSVVVVVHSDAIINIDRCVKALDDRIGLEYVKKSVEADMDVIKSLSDREIDNMVDANIVVDVKFDKQAGVFTVTGPSRNVLSAIDCIHNKMRQIKRAENNKSAADVLYSQIQWHWLREDRAASDSKEIPYEKKPNFVIETAYKEGKKQVELMASGGRVYVIDFSKLVEYPKTNVSDSVRVIRKDILKAGQSPLPPSWMSMSNNEYVKRVTLNSGAEYQRVEKQFLSQVRNGLFSRKVKNSSGVQVLKIERIQNRTVYQQYAAKKKLMEQQKSGSKQIERQLWHGTVEANLPSIINNGFNRSYCGVNGVLYGQGVYFAADASYSAQSYLTGYKPGMKRYILMVKALTGEFVKGNAGMRVLPPVKSSNSTVLYDSAVDDVNSPMEFVIFHDTQAYPEYLITYTS